MIPLPVILVEFLGAFGLALLLANLVALVRVRRDARAAEAGDGDAAAATPGDAVTPSRGRIWTGLAIGLFVTLWAVASWFTNGYRF